MLDGWAAIGGCDAGSADDGSLVGDAAGGSLGAAGVPPQATNRSCAASMKVIEGFMARAYTTPLPRLVRDELAHEGAAAVESFCARRAR